MKSDWCISQSKWHYHKFVMYFVSYECKFVNIFLFQLNLIITQFQIKLQKINISWNSSINSFTIRIKSLSQIAILLSAYMIINMELSCSFSFSLIMCNEEKDCDSVFQILWNLNLVSTMHISFDALNLWFCHVINTYIQEYFPINVRFFLCLIFDNLQRPIIIT